MFLTLRHFKPNVLIWFVLTKKKHEVDCCKENEESFISKNKNKDHKLWLVTLDS